MLFIASSYDELKLTCSLWMYSTSAMNVEGITVDLALVLLEDHVSSYSFD